MRKADSTLSRYLFIAGIICIPVIIGLFGQRAFAIYFDEGAESAVATTILVNTTDDEFNEDGDCSLREAIAAANLNETVDACAAGSGWDTVEVPAGTYELSHTGDGDDWNSTGDLDILDSVNIVGAGAGVTIIDGYAADRVIHVDPQEYGVTLDLSDVTITNGSADHGGGLRAHYGATIIRNSDFTQNSADDTGGGIQIESGTMHVFSTKIQHNTVISSSECDGGGMYIEHSVVELTDSTISDNIAFQGGGLYADRSSVSLVGTKVLSNANHINPSRESKGGGIYVNSGQLFVTRDSEVAYNSTPNYGGGIMTESEARLSVSDSWLHHNESGWYGGGLYSGSAGTNIHNSIIEYNTADYTNSGEGGGIYHEDDLVVEDSTIAHNHAYYGGGIWQDDDALVISNTIVFSNTSYEGGGIYQYDGGTYISRSVFEENIAENTGGAINNYEDSGVYVEDSTFMDNEAYEGGAIYIYDESALNVDRSSFSGNVAETDGGAIYLYEYSVSEIRNSTFSDNYAGDDGGAIYISWPTADIQFSTIVNNAAGSSAGGIYSTYYVAPQNSIIAGNSANGSVTNSYADCYIEDTLHSGGNNLFGENTGCRASRFDETVPNGDVFTTVLALLADNGGVQLPDGSHPQTHALLAGSQAIDAGNDTFCLDTDQTGTIRPSGNACDQGAYESSYSATATPPTQNVITVDTTDDELNNDGDCSLREAVQAANTEAAVDSCSAGDGWDTIQLPAGTYRLSIEGAEEDANQTGDLDVLADLTIKGQDAATTVIDANDIDRVLDLDDVVLHIVDVTLQYGNPPNYSGYGGCVLNYYGYLIVLDSVITQCESSNDGGAIYTDEGVMRIQGSQISSNYANDENGGVYNYYGVATIRDSKVISNTGQIYGGGVMSYVGTTRISDSEILSNTVGGSEGGGGVYHAYGNVIIEDGTEIRYNESQSDGGGVIGWDGVVLIRDSYITHNHTDADGGGVIATDGAWIQNTLIAYNVAEANGGGFYGGGLLQNVTIRDNEAIADSGGGLWTWAILEDSVVSGNEAEFGAGIAADGLSLYNTRVMSNVSQGGEGAGVYLVSYGGAYIVDSTIRDNIGNASVNGAGIYSDHQKAPVVVRRSTISDNAGADEGGGIYSFGVIDLLNSVVSGNEAAFGGGVYAQSTLGVNYSTIAANYAITAGGGIANDWAVSIMNSIVAGNEANNSITDGNADCVLNLPTTSVGYSLYGSGTGCTVNGRYDRVVEPSTVFTAVIEELADNGGDTWTHALKRGSLAIDAADDDFCPATDQRGISRPLGSSCDMGSYESEEFAYDMAVYLPFLQK